MVIYRDAARRQDFQLPWKVSDRCTGFFSDRVYFIDALCAGRQQLRHTWWRLRAVAKMGNPRRYFRDGMLCLRSDPFNVWRVVHQTSHGRGSGLPDRQ